MSGKRCAQCAFAFADCDDWQLDCDLVECRVNPPVPKRIDSGAGPSAAFPTVKADWWCGLFRPRTKEAGEKEHGDGQ